MVKVNPIPVFGEKKNHYYLLKNFHQNFRRNHQPYKTLTGLFFSSWEVAVCVKVLVIIVGNILELLCAIFSFFARSLIYRVRIL